MCDRIFIKIIENPYNLRTGDIVEYKNQQYYFRPNGSVSYLYLTLQDFKSKRKNRKYIATRKLKGCNLYADSEIFNMETEESSSSSDDETFEQILSRRRSLFTEEELRIMFLELDNNPS